MNLLKTKAGRMVTFFLLYLTEGIPLGFTAVAIATQMRRQGVGPAEIGVFVGTLYLPWSFKWIVGPFVDIISSDKWGRRRVWIFGAQSLMALSLLLGMGVDFTTEIKLFTALIFIHNIFGATQDVAIDALACTVLPENERGLANGLMFGAAYLGQAIGGSGVLFLTRFVEFNTTFIFVVAVLLSITVFVVLPMKEPRSKPQIKQHNGSAFEQVKREIWNYLKTIIQAFFGSKGSFLGLLLALVPPGSLALSLALASNLAVELGMSDAKIGTLNLFSTLLAAAGCVFGGFISDKFDRRKILALYFASTTIPGLILAWYMHQYGWIMPIDTQMPDRPVAPAALMTCFWAVSLVFSLLHGLMYGTRSALFMDVCKPEVAATQFTAYMALMNLTITYTAFWQGWAIEAIGYPKTLVFDSAAGLVCLVFLPFMKTRKIQQR